MKGEKKKNSEFIKGYVCACAAYVSGHGLDTGVKDTLKCAGHINWDDIDEHDKELLKEYIEQESEGV
jgi:hypothetical protein